MFVRFSFIGTVLAFLLLALPVVTRAATVDDVLSISREQEYVTKMTLSIDHYSASADAIADGTLAQINIEYDADASFSTPKNQSFDIADLIDDGLYDSDSGRFTVTVTDLRGVKGYYFRAQFVNADGETGEWNTSGRYVTLPPRVKNLRVPSGKKGIRDARLKWNYPTRCESEGCVYTVKVFRRSNDGLVGTETAYEVNYVDVVGLAGGTKYYFKVQSCLDYYTCSTKYSDIKYFKTNTENTI